LIGLQSDSLDILDWAKIWAKFPLKMGEVPYLLRWLAQYGRSVVLYYL
jgi:hypothetical protein